MTRPRIDFYYDVVCPYAYLGHTQIEALASRLDAELVWKPFLLGGVFRALEAPAPSASVRNLERIWRFDCDPTAPKEAPAIEQGRCRTRAVSGQLSMRRACTIIKRCGQFLRLGKGATPWLQAKRINGDIGRKRET